MALLEDAGPLSPRISFLIDQLSTTSRAWLSVVLLTLKSWNIIHKNLNIQFLKKKKKVKLTARPLPPRFMHDACSSSARLKNPVLLKKITNSSAEKQCKNTILHLGPTAELKHSKLLNTTNT